MKGDPAWLFDCYPHPRRSGLVVWVKHGGTCSKRFVPYHPGFCVASDQQPLEVAERLLAGDGRVEATWRGRARLWLRGPLQEVVRVRPKRFQDTWGIATDLRKATKTTGFLLFDVDHSQESRWMHAQGLWSMCRLQVGPDGPILKVAEDEDRWGVEYPDPGLRCLRLAVQVRPSGHEPAFGDPLQAIVLGDKTVACARPGDPAAERETLRTLGGWLREMDPDVLLTHHGDRFDVPYLLHRIQALGLQHEVWLGRAPDPEPDRPDQKGKSIHTYGRWLYKTPAYYLRGRWHVDLAKKSLDSEDDRSDVHGIVYLARVANRRGQDVNRNGAGFALQQMQIDLATDWRVALPWKRNLVEDWKDAPTLGAVDRGGQLMVPTPGIHGDVAALDYSGYYPSLVVRHNLSSDTLNCQCCPDGETIPELGYHVCRQQGHQSEILRRLWPHRRWAKAVLRKAKSGTVDADAVAKARAVKSEHKALGVVCFGYFRYRNARFGCAEVHQAIQCYGRDGMTKARALAQAEGFRMVHALTDCIFIQRPGVTRDEVLGFARRVTDEVGVPMDVEGIYRWVVLLPSKTHSSTSEVGVPNRYYGKFEDGSLKVRGIEVQRHSTPPFLYEVQQAQLAVFQEADTPEAFLARIPRALKVAKDAAGRLQRREVEAAELGLNVQTRMAVEEYAANTGTKAALRRLRDAGTERKPGEYIQYVVTRTTGPWMGRAVPVELLHEPSPWFEDAPQGYDVDAYVRLLARHVETLLSPFGYTEDALHAWFTGRTRQVAVSRPAAAS
ncbi:MAG: DNA polymerase domain-containing protein [Thermoplasmatota archaeon]